MDYLLEFCYDGSEYKGYATQLHKNTIQDILQQTISKVFKQEIKITGASRTDTGVHAMYQCATFSADLFIEYNRVTIALNSILPKSIRIINCKKPKPDFHPRYSCTSKQYIYKINLDYDVFKTRYSHYHKYDLDVELMNEACAYFIGRHDFSSCCASGGSVVDKVRTIYNLDVTLIDREIIISVTGDGFLYNMVRIIVGNLLAVGEKKINPSYIKSIIDSCDRSNSFPTAAACGLYLKEINYRS